MRVSRLPRALISLSAVRLGCQRQMHAAAVINPQTRIASDKCTDCTTDLLGLLESGNALKYGRDNLQAT